MAQGTRNCWNRIAATGLGLLVCSSLVGCMNNDKHKDTKLTKQPTPGLPGTTTLPNNNANAKNNLPPNPYGANTGGIQQTGGFGQMRPGTGTPPAPNWNVQPGAPGTIGAPTQPGTSFAPSVQPGAPVAPPSWGSNNTGTSPQPLATMSPSLPAHFDPLPQPPAPPPGHVSASGSELVGGSVVQPPLAPVAPIAPTIGGPTKGGF
jgi:hypothetical protein